MTERFKTYDEKPINWEHIPDIERINDETFINFPTADDMRKKQQTFSEEELHILRAINTLLNNVPKGNSITYQGYVPKLVRKFLESKDFKIECGDQYNQSYTVISW